MLQPLIRTIQTLAGEARAYHDIPPEGEAIVRHIADMEQHLIPLYIDLYTRSAQLALETKTAASEVVEAGRSRAFMLTRLEGLQRNTEWIVSLDGKVFTETTRYRAAISNDERILKQAEERARMDTQHLWEEHMHLRREFDMQRQRMEELRRIPFFWAIMERQSIAESGKSMMQRIDEAHDRVRRCEQQAERFSGIWQRVRGLPELGEKIENAVQDLANSASILKGHLDETLHMIHLAEESKVAVGIEVYAQTLIADAHDIARLVE